MIKRSLACFCVLSAAALAGPADEAAELRCRGEYDASEAAYRRALKAEPESAPALLGLCDLLLELARYDDVRTLAAGRAEGKGGLEFRIRLAEALIRTGKHDEAEKLLAETLREAPGHARARAALAELKDKTGARDAAIALLKPLADAAEKTETADPEERWIRAEAVATYARWTGDAILAKQTTEQVFPDLLKRRPEDIRPHVVRIGAFIHAGQKHDALAETKEARAKNPRHPALNILLHEFGAAIAVAPGSVEARVGRAIQLLMGDPEEAQERRKEEGKEQEYNPEAAIRLPTPAERKEALEHLEKALAVDPTSPEAHAARAAWHYYDGELPAFEAECKKAWATDPRCGWPQFWVAKLSANPRDQRESIQWLRKAVETDPGFAEAWAVLGAHCMNEGYEEEAEKAFRKAWALDRFNITTKNYLTLLDAYPAEFEVRETKHLRIRLNKSESALLFPYVSEWMEGWYDELSKRYKFEPETPIRVEILDDTQDFAVRGFGVPGFPALGVCLGRVVVNQSPKTLAPQNRSWAAVLRHEFMHVFSVQATEGLVSRWFTEGLSVYEERRCRPEWDWEERLDEQLYDAFHTGALMPIGRLNEGFNTPKVRMYYHLASRVCEYIDARYGVDGLIRMMAEWKKGTGAKTRAAEMMLGWSGLRDAPVVQAALGVSLDELNRGFQKWLDETYLSKWKIPVHYPARMLPKLEEEAKEGDLAAQIRLARACFQNGRAEEAGRICRKWTEAHAKSAASLPEPQRLAVAEAHLLLGHQAFDREEYDEAKKRFKEAEALGSRDFYLFYGLGRLFEEEERRDEAIVYYLKAQESFPKQVYDEHNTYQKLYFLFKDSGKIELAQEQAERLVRIAHETEKPRRWLLERYLGLKRFDAAADMGQQLLYLDPYDLRTHLALAKAYKGLDRPERSQAELEAAGRCRKYAGLYAKSREEQDRILGELDALAAGDEKAVRREAR